MNSKISDFLKGYMRLADHMVSHASKEQLGECARILALNVAHYANRYGELPLEAHLDFLHAEELSEEQAKLVERGLEVFVGVLGKLLKDEAPLQH
jgi:hypothetical protein